MAGVTVMALSSDYRLLVAGSQDGSMLVWNTEVFEMLHALPGHFGEPSTLFMVGKVFSCLKKALTAWQSWSCRHTDTSQLPAFSQLLKALRIPQFVNSCLIL